MKKNQFSVLCLLLVGIIAAILKQEIIAWSAVAGGIVGVIMEMESNK